MPTNFTATGFSGNSRPRRLKIAEPSGCKSRVADQSGVWLIGNSRPIRLKIEQPCECKSPHADQFKIVPPPRPRIFIVDYEDKEEDEEDCIGMSTGQASPDASGC